jgi:tetratricopeptide (TPR) repeat protein
MTPEQIEEHDRVFEQAVQPVKYEIIVHGRPQASIDDESLRLKLNQSLRLFDRVLELHPGNWSAMWLVGKVYQRLGNQSTAFTWFVRAHQINPSQPDVAREASLCAMELGRSDDAVFYARGAIECQPSNTGLHANLALAFLLAGRLDEAKSAIHQSVVSNPEDIVSQTVGSMIEHFVATGHKPPGTTSSLENYWKDH